MQAVKLGDIDAASRFAQDILTAACSAFLHIEIVGRNGDGGGIARPRAVAGGGDSCLGGCGQVVQESDQTAVLDYVFAASGHAFAVKRHLNHAAFQKGIVRDGHHGGGYCLALLAAPEGQASLGVYAGKGGEEGRQQGGGHLAAEDQMIAAALYRIGSNGGDGIFDSFGSNVLGIQILESGSLNLYTVIKLARLLYRGVAGGQAVSAGARQIQPSGIGERNAASQEGGLGERAVRHTAVAAIRLFLYGQSQLFELSRRGLRRDYRVGIFVGVAGGMDKGAFRIFGEIGVLHGGFHDALRLLGCEKFGGGAADLALVDTAEGSSGMGSGGEGTDFMIENLRSYLLGFGAVQLIGLQTACLGGGGHQLFEFIVFHIAIPPIFRLR